MPDYTTLPQSEVDWLVNRHFKDPDKVIVCNYAVSEVEAVARHFNIDISGIKIYSLPNATVRELVEFRNSLA